MTLTKEQKNWAYCLGLYFFAAVLVFLTGCATQQRSTVTGVAIGICKNRVCHRFTKSFNIS